YQQETDWSLTF
nr:immunoglobulin light chain junction region [Macaca mulatta]